MRYNTYALFIYQGECQLMSTLRDSVNSSDIRKKVFFTCLIVSVLCVLTLVPVPGLDHTAAMYTAAGWGSIGYIINILSIYNNTINNGT